MAIVGEGDARWIVTEREDGTNVGNWHWAERKRTSEGKQRLQAMVGMELWNTELGIATLTAWDSIEGEVSLNNRKGKLYLFYELALKGKWEARLAAQPDQPPLTGEIDVPEFGVTEEDFQISWTTQGSPASADAVRELNRTIGTTTLRAAILATLFSIRDDALAAQRAGQEVRNEVESESSAGMEHPATAPSSSSQLASSSLTSAPSVKTKALKSEVVFDCKASDLYQVLMDPNRVQAFTAAQATIDPTPGGSFSLFNGSVHGEFVSLEPDSKIVQKWRSTEWPRDHFSTVTITLADFDDGCHLSLHQTGIPASDFTRTKDGWTTWYWDRIKAVFGFGMPRHAV